jgi:KaiC/GvpD/RAD55 family RecA-like ATPase
MPKAVPTIPNVHRELVNAFNEKGNTPDKIAELIAEKEVKITPRALRDYFSKPEGEAAMLRKNIDALCNVLLGYDYQEAQARLSADIFSPERISKYKQHLEERCNSIRVLGMARPVQLTDIYTDTRFLSSPRSRIEKNLMSGLSDSSSPGRKDEILNVEEVLVKYSRLMVLGLPGSGKSTLLKHLALEYIDKKIHGNQYLPVFIELKRHAYRRNSKSLLEAILQEVGKFADIQEDRVIDLLEEGKFLILLDGLDEVTDKYFDDLYHDINEITELYPKNRFVMTCRTKVFSEYKFVSFADVEISGFDQNQINKLAEQWFLASQDAPISSHIEESSSEEDTEHFLEELSRYSSVKSLSSTPLLLTFLLYTFEYNNGIIARRKLTLCEDTVNVFVNEWDRTRRIKRDVNLIEILERKVLIDLFSYIAYSGFTADSLKTEWDENEITELINDFLERIDYKHDVKEVLKAFEANYGIIIEISKGSYSFLQQTFQEYFTAIYAVENQGKGILDEVIRNYILNRQWQEIFPLIVDRQTDSDSFLKEMIKYASSLAQDSNLNDFLIWLYSMTKGLMGDDASSSWRSLFISLDLDTDFYTGRLSKRHNVDRMYFHGLSVEARRFNRDRNQGTYSTDKTVVALWLAIIFALANEKVVEIFGSEHEDSLIKFRDIPEYLKFFLDISDETHLEGEIENVIKKAKKMNNKDLIHDLTTIQDSQPSVGASESDWHEWIDSIRNLMLNRFDIGHQVQFTDEQFEVLEEYVYVNRLIVQCLNESITTSASLKQRIVDNILLPFEYIDPDFRP